MKKLFFLFAALFVCTLSTFAYDFEKDGIYYNILNGDSVEVTSGSNSDSVTIPATVEYDNTTYRVTSIGYSAFSDCSSLTAVIIPNSVTSIGYEAFKRCSNLTSITIPNSVTSIGAGAFYRCSSLTAVTIPNSVTSIGNYAFFHCSSLTEVTMGNSVTSIGENAFYYCSSLTEITIPESVTSIGLAVFSNCSNLETIIVEIGNSTYHSADNCLIETATKTLLTGCKNSIIPADGSVTSIGENAFYYCSNLTEITIPESVTTIGSSAFWGCSNLTSITIPNSVTTIDYYAFRDCSKVAYITSRASTPPTTVYNAFSGVPTGAEVIVPCGAAPSYRVATGWTGFQYVNEDFVYDFNVTTNDEDGGLVQIIQEPSCSQAAIIKALPMDGYVFKAWSDGNTKSMRQITVEEDINLVAYFMAIDGSEGTEETGGVTVNPADNSVTFTWPSVGGAVTYVFTIYADAAQTDRICTLTCNAMGQLVNISFPRKKLAATQEGALLNFTIDGLDESTTYTYTLDSYDEDDELIVSHAGSFTTQTSETAGVETLLHSVSKTRKVFENGTIYIVKPNGERYLVDGRRVSTM